MNAQDPPSPPGGDGSAVAEPPPGPLATEQPPSDQAPPFEPPPAPGPRTEPPPLRRSTIDEVLGGVCGGLGLATGVDPLWFRLGFIFLALSTGVGVLLYIVLWIAIPEASDDEMAGLRGDGTVGPAKSGDVAVLFGIFLVVVGTALLVDIAFPWFDRLLWPAALMALGAGLLYLGARR